MARPSITHIPGLIGTEIRASLRSRLHLLILLVVPLVLSLFLGHIMVHTRVPANLALAVLDNDDSRISRDITRYLDAIPGTAVTYRVQDLEEGRRLLLSGRVRGVVEIPVDFSRNLEKARPARMHVYEDFNFLLPGRTLAKNMALLEGWLQEKYFENYFHDHGAAGYGGRFLSHLGIVEYHKLYNPNLEYTQFLLPGLLITLLYQVICVLSGMVLFTNKNLYTGTSGWQFLTAKLLAHGTLSLLPFLIIYGLLFPYFGLLTGNFWHTLGLYIPFSLATLLMGMLVSVLVKEPVFTTEIMIVIGAIGFTISGMTWPMKAFPDIVKFAARLIPLTPFLDNCLTAWYATGASLRPLSIWIYVMVLLVPVILLIKRVFDEKSTHHHPVGA